MRTTGWLSASLVLAAPGVAFATPPTIAFTSATVIDEGTAVTIEVAVSDPDGDTPTWSWDTDADGVFGEHAGATSYEVPATATDGTAMLRVGVEATDGVESRTAYRIITVNNVAPDITSTPPVDGAVRREYVYEVAVVDPAGENDPIRYLLTSRPPGMEIAGNRITWTPLPEHRGRSFPVILRVDDGDGGEDAQSWEIRVALNTPPSAATPLSPIMRERVPSGAPVTLVAENATDPDGDPLTYFFRVSRLSSFQPPELYGSGEVSEGADGTTSWTMPEPLADGLWYWQVWVSDGVVETSPRYAQLVVGEETTLPDAGPPVDGGAIPGIDAGTTPPRSGGCHVAPAGSGGAALLFALGALALVSRRRR